MGQPAARITDMHVCPMVTGIVPHVGGPILPPGAVTVLIGGLPAARVTAIKLRIFNFKNIVFSIAYDDSTKR